MGSSGGSDDSYAMAQAQEVQARQDRLAQQDQIAAAQNAALQQHQWSLDSAAQQQQQAATDKQNAITQFQNDLATATSGARTYAGQQEGTLGITGNDYGLMNNFNNALQATLSGIGSQQTGNAGALVNGQALFQQANSDTLAQQRNKLTQAYNQLFGNNYVNDNLQSNMFSTDEANALSTQQGVAQSALDRALARGQLNQTGYDYANQQLGTQAAAAQAKLKAAGQGVLSGYQQQLTDALSGAKTGIANWNYGDPTDFSQLQGQVGNYLAQDKANASGDFQNAIAGQNYFDPTSILSSAGTYQGTTGGTGTTVGTAAPAANTGYLSGSTDATQATKPVTAAGTLANQGVV